MTANILTFPGQFRPHVVEPADVDEHDAAETGGLKPDGRTIGCLTIAADNANAAALDCTGAIRFILNGNNLSEGSHVMGGETLTSLLQAALAIMTLRGMRDTDLPVGCAISKWLDSNEVPHG